jgi:hypothetical protein
MGEDCMICTEAFAAEDLEYPIACPGSCGFNFCTSCLDHLIRSSKTDYEEASDGSRQVKVKLMCPQCLADLSKQGPKVSRQRQYSKIANLPNSELTASELRLKHSVLADAALRKPDANPQSLSPTASGLGSSYDEEAEDDSSFDPPIDKVLLRGLEFSMSHEEQFYIQQLFYFGDVDQLAQATQMLSSIQEMTRKGPTPSTRHSGATSKHNPSFSAVGDAAKADTKAKADAKTAAGRAILMSNQNYARFMSRYNKHWKANPLPARMPVQMTLNLKEKEIVGRNGLNFPVKFVADEWDGSVADAFSRVHISRNGKVNHEPASNTTADPKKGGGWFGTKKATNNSKSKPAVFGEGTPHNRVFGEGTPHHLRCRLRVSRLSGQAAGKGVLAGDVLTHINGEKFEDGGLEALNFIISRHYALSRQAGDDIVTFSLVFNAEPAVASALQRRGAVPPPYSNR